MKLHVLLNYYPAIGMVMATLALVAGLWFRNGRFVGFVLKAFVVLAILTLFVVLTGEFASWAVDRYSGDRKEALQAHKISATIAFAATTLTGIAAGIALFRGRGDSGRGKWATVAALVLAIAASAVLVATIFKGRYVKWADTTATSAATTKRKS